jgi:hypothetical protein
LWMLSFSNDMTVKVVRPGFGTPAEPARFSPAFGVTRFVR